MQICPPLYGRICGIRVRLYNSEDMDLCTSESPPDFVADDCLHQSHLRRQSDLQKAGTRHTSKHMDQPQSDQDAPQPMRSSKRLRSLLGSIQHFVNMDRRRIHEKDTRTMIEASKGPSYAEEATLEAGTRERSGTRRWRSHRRLRSKAYKTLLAVPILAVTVW